MPVSLILVCLWVVAAAVLSSFPSNKKHWPLAYVLIAVGVPLLAFVYVGAGVGAFVLSVVVGALFCGGL